jgi:hypothetical protein
MPKPKGILGQDYVTLGGRGDDRLQNNGAIVSNNPNLHLSVDFGHSTICGHAVDKFLLTYDDVYITCPDCIKTLVERAGNSHV